MSDPKVTVIVSCYNSEKYIRQALDSILSQDYDRFQVIAIDDGSTDSTASILKAYGDRIIVLTHSDGGNYGQFAAL
ncbi:MAG: glycosyltransferase, partial [Geobacteraceae bacterium]|nr:glycosyltransferase [Geobacteraceae bacterium]